MKKLLIVCLISLSSAEVVAIEPVQICIYTVFAAAFYKGLHWFKQKEVYNQLYDLIKQGDLSSIKEFCTKEGINLNKEVNDTTPLSEACNHNQQEIVQWLIDEGVDVNKAAYAIGSPLSAAIRIGDLSLIRILVDAGADVNTPKGADILTPLGYAAFSGLSVESVRLIDETMAIVEFGKRDSSRFITRNIFKRGVSSEMMDNYAQIVQYLLENGADPNNDKHFIVFHPIQAAAIIGNYKVIELLIKNNADRDLKVRILPRTALEWAKDLGHQKVVKMLQDAGAKE